jgi:hypothetical protein
MRDPAHTPYLPRALGASVIGMISASVIRMISAVACCQLLRVTLLRASANKA